MKSKMVFVIVIIFSILLFGCSQRNDLPENSPTFLDVTIAREDLKTLIYGSHGWWMANSYNSPYIYAQSGVFIVRYSIAENIVDRVVNIGKIPDGYTDRAMSFSPDGSCVVIYNTWKNHSKFEPSDIYLLDFDNSEVKFLAEKPENLNIKLLPKNLRDSFDSESIGWNTDFKNLDKFDYNIESEYDPNIGTIWYAIDKEEQKNEITALRNSHNASEPPCVVIDNQTIGTLVPVDGNNDGYYLGYYKFVLIDVTTDTILQEYPIIDKTYVQSEK